MAPAAPAVHDYAVLGYCTEGRARIDTGAPYELATGDVLLIPSGMPHRMEAPEAPEIWGVGFCPVCFLAPDGEDLLAPFDRVRRGAGAVVSIAPDRRPFFETLLAELERASGGGAFAIQRSLVTLLMAEVTSALGAHSPPGGEGGLVDDVLRIVERECLGPLSLRDVAERLHRSPAHLTTQVKRITGRSVQEWIIAGRLSEARRRLLHSDEAVDIIAERVGYADATHFIRIFKREHGATPAAWRTQNRPLHPARPSVLESKRKP